MEERPGLRRISPWWTAVGQHVSLVNITVCNLGQPMRATGDGWENARIVLMRKLMALPLATRAHEMCGGESSFHLRSNQITHTRTPAITGRRVRGPFDRVATGSDRMFNLFRNQTATRQTRNYTRPPWSHMCDRDLLSVVAWDPLDHGGHSRVSMRERERAALVSSEHHGHPQISRSLSGLPAESRVRSNSLPFPKHTDHPKTLRPDLRSKHRPKTKDGRPRHPKPADEIHPIGSARTVFRIGQEGMAVAMDRRSLRRRTKERASRGVGGKGLGRSPIFGWSETTRRKARLPFGRL